MARTAERGQDPAARIRNRVPDARIEVLTADLAVLDQVRALAEEVLARRDRPDVLILCAGVARPRLELTVDGIEVDFATNHLSAFLLVDRPQELLRASAPDRVVTVSSAAHRQVREIDFNGLAAGRNINHLRTYSTTKLLTILFTTEHARRLAGSGVTANAADPGFARSSLRRDAPRAFRAFLTLPRPFQIPATNAADTPVHWPPAWPRSTAATSASTATASPLALDPTAAARLWELSTDLVTRAVP